MKKIAFAIVAVLAFVSLAQAQTYYRPQYTQRPLDNPGVAVYPYFLENRTGGAVEVHLYVNKVRWEYVIEPGNEVLAMLPLGARVKVEAYVDVGKNNGRKKERTCSAYYLREEHDGSFSRGWVLYR